MKEIQYQQLCEEVRSTDFVTFNLQRNLFALVAFSVFITVYAEDFVSVILWLFTMLMSFIFYFWDLRNMQVCYAAIQQVKKLEKSLNLPFSIYAAPRSQKFLFFSLSKLWTLHILYFSIFLLSLTVPWLQFFLDINNKIMYVHLFLSLILGSCFLYVGRKLHKQLTRI